MGWNTANESFLFRKHITQKQERLHDVVSQWLNCRILSNLPMILHKNKTTTLGRESSINHQLNYDMIHYLSAHMKLHHRTCNWGFVYPKVAAILTCPFIFAILWIILYATEQSIFDVAVSYKFLWYAKNLGKWMKKEWNDM